MNRLYDGSIIEVDGMNFKVTIENDDLCEPPWEFCDGHGPVSDWERRNKGSHEMVLCEYSGCRRFYDFQEAVKIAKRDRWGTAGEFRTKGEQAHFAALANFEYLRRWCADQWEYVLLGVDLLDEDGDSMHEWEHIGGVEYDPNDTSYAMELAEDLARQIISRIAHTFDVIEPHEELSDDTGYVIAAEYVSI